MAKINDELFQELSQPVIDIYLKIQEELLVNISGRFDSDDPELNNITQWQISKLEQFGGLSEENAKVIRKLSPQAIKELNKMLKEVSEDALQDNDEQLKLWHDEGADLLKPPPITESPVLLAILRSFQRSALQIFNLVNSTMLQQANQIYRDIINTTTASVLLGTKTPQQALRDTINQWADVGVPCLIDKSGKRWGAEGYVSMVTRTMSNNIANDMQEERFQEWGVDLVEISSHIGARPLCAPFQGKIFSLSGRSKRYPSLASTSKGQPSGLFGINCGHIQYPYVQGFTRKIYNQYPKKENERAYDNSQKQRKLERDIRNAKTRLRLQQETGDETGIKQANELIKKRQKAMREFINETGRTRRPNREQIV